MVIIANKVGQLCNRLFQFSYFIANAIENKYKVSNPCFDEYCKYFESTSMDVFFDFQISIRITPFKIFDKIILRYLSRNNFSPLGLISLNISNHHSNYDLKQVEYLKLAKEKTVFARGWLFKDNDNLRKHRNTLIEIFKPSEIYRNEVSKNILRLKNKFDYVIGVHIRRGDYKTWNNGDYYFSDHIYLQKMLQIKQEIDQKGRSCCFVICSNEKIDQNSFNQVECDIRTRHFIVDLYLLAECDYIIGPPSTYSLWAAYYGNKPFSIVEKEDTKIQLANFQLY